MKAYETVDQYIRSFPGPVRAKLERLRKLVHEVVPEVEEKISYGMPAFTRNGTLVWFAAHTQHIGFYPTARGMARFKSELSKYKSSKGAVQFPMDEPLPLGIIRRIVAFRARETAGKSGSRYPRRSSAAPAAKKARSRPRSR